MWTSALAACTQILDKFKFLIFVWITLRFKTNYAQLYPEGNGHIWCAVKIWGEKCRVHPVCVLFMAPSIANQAQ